MGALLRGGGARRRRLGADGGGDVSTNAAPRPRRAIVFSTKVSPKRIPARPFVGKMRGAGKIRPLLTSPWIDAPTHPAPLYERRCRTPECLDYTNCRREWQEKYVAPRSTGHAALAHSNALRERGCRWRGSRCRGSSSGLSFQTRTVRVLGQAYLSAAASGMMALTGIVFAMAFVMVQFSAVAYSPRLVLWLRAIRHCSTRSACSSPPSSTALSTCLGRPRRHGKVPAVLVGIVRDPDRRQHAHVRPADAAARRSPDRQRVASDRRRRDATYQRHVPASDRAVRRADAFVGRSATARAR